MKGGLILFLVLLIFVSGCSELLKPLESPFHKNEIIGGRVYLIYLDDFENPENSRLAWFIDSKEGFYELEDIDISSQLSPGSLVQVEGILEENKIGSYGSSLNIISQPPQPGPEFNEGENKILVLLGEYDNRPFEIPSQNITNTLFGNYPSMNDFYIEASGNNSWFNGTVIGPLNLGNTSPLCNWANLDLYSDSLMIAADPFVDFTQYKRILYVFPNCFIGIGEVGASLKSTPDGDVNNTRAWSGYVFSPEDWRDDSFISVSSHELGHNFGAFHANFAACGNVNFGDNVSNCSNHEYGNFFSVMGGTNPMTPHFTATHKQTFGWLDENTTDVLAVNRSGVFDVNILEGNFGTRRVIIPYGSIQDFPFTSRTGIEKGFYSVEYRQPNNYAGDWWFPWQGKYGVFITFQGLPNYQGAPWVDSSDHLIYPHKELPICPPDCASARLYSVMVVGDTYRDNNSNLYLEVTNTDNISAKIEVDLNPCERKGSPNLCNPGFEIDDFHSAHFLLNGKFEGIANEWAITSTSQSGSATATRSSIAHEGIYGMYVSDTDPNSPIALTYLTEASPGKKYECNAYGFIQWRAQTNVENYHDGRQDLVMRFNDANRNRIQDLPYPINCDNSEICSTVKAASTFGDPTPWEKISVTRTAPAGTKYVECFVNSQASDVGATRWDSFEIKDITKVGGSPLILKEIPKNIRPL